jgi:hypothetical protein
LCKASAFLLDVHAEAILLFADGEDSAVKSFLFDHRIGVG